MKSSIIRLLQILFTLVAPLTALLAWIFDSRKDVVDDLETCRCMKDPRGAFHPGMFTGYMDTIPEEGPHSGDVRTPPRLDLLGQPLSTDVSQHSAVHTALPPQGGSL